MDLLNSFLADLLITKVFGHFYLPTVDPLDKALQMVRANLQAVSGKNRRKSKNAFLQFLLPQAEAILLPVKNFHQVFALVIKYE